MQAPPDGIPQQNGDPPRARAVRGSASREALQNTDQRPQHSVDQLIGPATNAGENSNSPASGYDNQSLSSGYFEQLRSMLETRTPVRAGMSLFSPQSQKASRGLSELEHTAEMDYSLPMHKTADSLLGIYWSEIHPFSPFVHKPSFQAQYDRLWERDASPGAPIFHCMLNTIFALSCQLNPNSRQEARRSASASYFDRARHLLQFDLFEPRNLEDVQALLLMGQYLQNTKATARAWVVVGPAIRTLQELRLHDGTSTPASTQRDREMFRRIWHGCHMMDRIQSVTLGLPAMLWTLSGESVVPLPSPIDDEYLSAEADGHGVQPADRPSIIHFLRHALLLGDLLTGVMIRYYSTPKNLEHARETEQQRQKRPEYSTIVAFENQLGAFWNSLPSHLRHSRRTQGPSVSNKSRLFQYQAAVLRARFLYVRILLFRPMLGQLMFQVDHEGLTDLEVDEVSVEQSAMIRAATVCITSAQEVISLIYRELGQSSNLLPAFWNPAIFVHSAATVLIAARQRPAIRAKFSDKSLEEVWQQAMSILERSESPSVSARQWVEHLQNLRQTSMEHQADISDGQTMQQPPAFTQQVVEEDATSSSLPALTEEYGFHSSDLVGMEEMDWSFLDVMPLAGL